MLAATVALTAVTGLGTATAQAKTAKITKSAAAKPENLATLQKTLHTDLVDTSDAGSVLVYDSTTGKTLYSYDPNTARLPASVEKLYTTSTALMKFGADAELKTRVYGVGKLSSTGTFTGTLYLRGGGDPSFGSVAYNNYNNFGLGASIGTLARALKADGITRLNGSIIGDASYFDSLGGGPDTNYKANTETEGIIGALIYNAGFTSIYDYTLQTRPVRSAASALASAMRGAGIAVPSSVKIGFGTTPSAAKLLATLYSPPISTLAYLTNSPSNDFFAEMLLKNIGATYGAAGSTAAGAAVVRSVIKGRLDLTPRLNDGSGLSRYDRTTATEVVSLLRQMRSNTAFYNSLAIAGVRGTMQYEMLKSRAVNNCRGKTGTLHDVANLVGYCTARNGDQLVFAFLMNDLPYDYTYAHGVEDEMGVALANYDG